MAAKSKSRSGSGPAADGEDAITLLTRDHRDVKAMFEQFKQAKENDASEDEKAELVAQICRALTVHSELEEEIFYPAVREAIDDEDQMDEALVEHQSARELISLLEEAEPDEELYDARVTVLGEQIDHHVREEEGEMFTKARSADLDLAALYQQMVERRNELLAEADDEDDEDDDDDDDEEEDEEDEQE